MSKVVTGLKSNPVTTHEIINNNGWRAIGDTDTEEYINAPGNNMVVDFDRLVEIEPAVLAIYDMPVGTDLEFCHDETGRFFVDSNTGKRLS